MTHFYRSLFLLILAISTKCTFAQVVINEFMASNTATVKDNAGEYDDWIELYNTSNSAFDLSGYYLTDSSGDLKKWKIKKGTIIPAKGYAIFWADEDSSQGNTNHVNFKLSSLGEMVLLVDSNKNIIDQITYGAQVTDKSYARYPNGTGSFSIRASTHNYSNGGEVVAIEHAMDRPISIYPNPASSKLCLTESESLNNAPFKIHDIRGQTVKRGLYAGDIDISDITSGQYYLEINNTRKPFVIHENK